MSGKPRKEIYEQGASGLKSNGGLRQAVVQSGVKQHERNDKYSRIWQISRPMF
jgi:hypothetical protein